MPVLEDDQIFERYRIVRWLGSGVAGESYEAEDRMLLRKVTLKLIHPWSTLPDAARRQFFREMQGLSVLNHPYLASVLDYGEVDGRIYVARRYVSSGSLLGADGRLWFRPPLPVADAFKYLHQLAQVLNYIHQHGYLHGFLTFSNVLVLRGPNVENERDYAPFLLADAGLANFVRRFGSPQITTLPVSAAPEQLGKRVMPASDQFALAVLLYFWLAGRPPYLGTPAEVEELKLTRTITPLSTINPGVTVEQDGIILRGLTVYPEERYPSVLAFTNALLTSLHTLPLLQEVLPGIFEDQPETPREILSMPDLPQDNLPTEASLREAEVPLSNLSGSPEDADSALETDTESADLQPTEPFPRIQETPRVAEDAPLEDAERSSQEEPVLSYVNLPASSASGETTVAPPASPDEVAVVELEIQAAGEEEALISREEEAPSAHPKAAPAQPESPTPREEEAPSAHVETAPAQPDTIFTEAVPRLLVSGPYASDSSEFFLTKEETHVGRAGASDLLLDYDNLTSRHHALFCRAGAQVRVFDKRSNNGVFVNGQRIEVEQGCELADGDHISIGSYELIFRSAVPSVVTSPTE